MGSKKGRDNKPTVELKPENIGRMKECAPVDFEREGILGGRALKALGEHALKDLGIEFFSFPAIDPETNGQRFIPPAEDHTPEQLFKPTLNRCSLKALRYIRNNNQNEVLVFIDGCCLNNGKVDARAGFSVVYRPEGSPDVVENLHVLGAIKSRLERKGPSGKFAAQTSNRAELRAAIAALQFRIWTGEGFSRFVIATDSEYLVKGATEWMRDWKKNNWHTNHGAAVKNKDLWILLLKELDRWSEEGMLVLFWLIPREQNALADRLAKEAAHLEDVQEFAKISGIGC